MVNIVKFLQENETQTYTISRIWETQFLQYFLETSDRYMHIDLCKRCNKYTITIYIILCKIIFCCVFTERLAWTLYVIFILIKSKDRIGKITRFEK